MGSSGYITKSSSRWDRQWSLRVQTREDVWYVPIKTRQPTHVDSEAVESSQTSFDNIEDQKVLLWTTKGWAVRVIREERCVTIFV